MTGATVWQGDCCPACGCPPWQRIAADGPVTGECGCGWPVTWTADPDGGGP